MSQYESSSETEYSSTELAVREVKPREYQIEIFEKLMDNNGIIYLPTGSGKTFLSCMVIKYYSKDLKRSLDNFGKRTFFLTNTVPLVAQQAESIRMYTPFVVGEFVGSMNVDMWDINMWKTILEKFQVLVMTSQIFLNMLLHGFIKQKQVNLIIFDECHHAVSKHPMKLIMEKLKNNINPVDTGSNSDIENYMPKIIGLTATLFISNVKTTNEEEIMKHVNDLEMTFNAKVVTAVNREMVLAFSTNPSERVIPYDCTDDAPAWLLQEIESIQKTVNILYLCKNAEIPIVDPELLKDNIKLMNIKSKQKDNKEINNSLNDLMFIAKDLGLFCAYICTLARILILEKKNLNFVSTEYNCGLRIITTKLHMLRYMIFEKCLSTVPKSERPIKFSTNKILELLNILSDVNISSVLIFVERRSTAKVLSYFLQELAESNTKFNHIKCDFMVGAHGGPIKDVRESAFHDDNNKCALKRFNCNDINVLVASNVIEEGIDISHCNIVIKFDEIKTFRSYVQSKGRARHKHSKYYIFVDRKSISGQFGIYSRVESILNHIVIEGFDERILEKQSEEIECLEPYTRDGVQVTENSAVSLVHRYCNTLPDFGNHLLWYIETLPPDQCKGEKKYIGYVQFPASCPLKKLIMGPACTSKDIARRAVAILACKELHQATLLNEHMLPLRKLVVEEKIFFPHWENNDSPPSGKPGTTKCSRLYKKYCPKWSKNCRPNSKQNCYLHLIKVMPNYDYPDTSRLRTFYNLIKSSNTFGILTETKWPNLASFPIFVNVGQVHVELCVNINKFKLSLYDINKLFNFHCLLFNKYLRLVKPFVVKDLYGENDSYMIVPIINNNIDWQTIEANHNLPNLNENLINIEKIENDLVGKVVMTNYDTSTSFKCYVITKICRNLSPLSPFENKKFDSYANYYHLKYNINVKEKSQPLFEVRAISHKMNCVIPRIKENLSSQEIEEYLIPELCRRIIFPAEYMLKLTFLPSILHRISRLLIAEDCRQQIQSALDIPIFDVAIVPRPLVWKPKTDPAKNKNILLEKKSNILNKLDKKKQPMDIERRIDFVSLRDIEYYKEVLTDSFEMMQINEEKKSVIYNLIEPQEMKFLNSIINSYGPEQIEVLEALTANCTGDFIDYERLETLGDSFLKFAVSSFLYFNFIVNDEGQLTNLKGKIIGNRNLFYCGRVFKIGEMVQVKAFDYKKWKVPGYMIDKQMQRTMAVFDLPIAAIENLILTNEEVERGTVNEERIENLYAVDLEKYQKAKHSDFLEIQEVPDKIIADCVEALIGLYLKTHGIDKAFKLIKWLGIVPPCMIDSFLNPEKPTSLACEDLDEYLIQPKQIENKLQYNFLNKKLLLEALTHPSFSHVITDNYERLEFLGDALIDFLITSHIFTYCDNLSPGKLTDLRSSLVNNVTFGCLAVKYNFHKHLLIKSLKTTEAIMKFEKKQKERNHQIGPDIFLLIQDFETSVAQIVDVPKVLGDIFESIIAAVYLDTGKCLKTTWKILYNLMKNEIDTFSKNIPLNIIRMMYESPLISNIKFSNISTAIPGKVSIGLCATIKNKNVTCCGVGHNKASAKLAAAKLALNETLHDPFSEMLDSLNNLNLR